MASPVDVEVGGRHAAAVEPRQGPVSVRVHQGRDRRLSRPHRAVRHPASRRALPDVPPIPEWHRPEGLLREALPVAPTRVGAGGAGTGGSRRAASSTAGSRNRPPWCGRRTWPRSRSTRRWRSPPTWRPRGRWCSTSIRARRPRSSSAASSPSGFVTCWSRSGSTAGARRPVRRACRCTSRLNTDGVTHDATADFALAVGQVMERQMPGKVTTVMAKVERPGKIFIDWSQNAHHKTTIAPYSLACPTRPDRVDAGDLGRGRRLRVERRRTPIRSR